MLNFGLKRIIIVLVIFMIFFAIDFKSIALAESLKIATWNIENLQVGSPKDYVFLKDYAEDLEADIIALQEVDGAEAAQQIFDKEDYNFYFSSRNNRQRTGFAVRKEINVTQNPDYTALNVSGGLRYGTDITVSTDTEKIRLLSIHLKSGCFSRPLNSSTLRRGACNRLSQQIPILEKWIDSRADDGIPFAVMGDFNRRLNIAGDDFWEDIDDGIPANADLIKVTEGKISDCFNRRYPEYIDHIVLDKQASQWLEPSSFQQKLYQRSFEFRNQLSDHCAIAVDLNIPGNFSDTTIDSFESNQKTNDSLEVIITRLEEIELELQNLRNLLQFRIN